VTDLWPNAFRDHVVMNGDQVAACPRTILRSNRYFAASRTFVQNKGSLQVNVGAFLDFLVLLLSKVGAVNSLFLAGLEDVPHLHRHEAILEQHAVGLELAKYLGNLVRQYCTCMPT
jgi:hypothetical protein